MAKPEFAGRIIALDIATELGWCVGKPTDETPLWGSVKIKGDTHAKACIFLEVWFKEMLERWGPEWVVFETPSNPAWLGKGTSAQAILKLNNLANTIEEVCERRKIRCNSVHGQRWKKTVCGNAKASKKMHPYPVITSMAQRGWTIPNDNEADAVGVWIHTVGVLAPVQALKFDPLLRRAHVRGLCAMDTATGLCGVHGRPMAECQNKRGMRGGKDLAKVDGRRRRAVGQV